MASIYGGYRALVDWWHGYPEDGLDFHYQQTIHHEYSTEEVITRIPSLKWYLQQRVNNKSYVLSIGGVYKQKLLPIIDADTEKDMLNASLWLEENKIEHAILASGAELPMLKLPPPPLSPINTTSKDYCPRPNGGFWIIINRPGKWSDIKNWLNIPGQDDDYLRFSTKRKMCYLRAEMKVGC